MKKDKSTPDMFAMSAPPREKPDKPKPPEPVNIAGIVNGIRFCSGRATEALDAIIEHLHKAGELVATNEIEQEIRAFGVTLGKCKALTDSLCTLETTAPAEEVDLLA